MQRSRSAFVPRGPAPSRLRGCAVLARTARHTSVRTCTAANSKVNTRMQKQILPRLGVLLMVALLATRDQACAADVPGPFKASKLLTPESEEETPFDASVQTLFYKARSRGTGNMWDTWLFSHEGTFYLYYLANAQGQWDNISMASSSDGVHWQEIGRVLSKGRGVTWMGTGSTWKSPHFEQDAKFFMNFSEWKGPRQTIFFAESKDLIHWTRLANEYEFVQDERWYERNGRWDCIWVIPRPGGGLYGYWTATPRAESGGRFGFGETLDGITWKALEPPKVTGVGEGEVGAIEKIGNQYYMMFGTGGLMVTLVADRPEGPFRAAHSNFRLLAGHTYFSRFFPTPEGLLVNHHSIARDGQVYFGTLKATRLDAAGALRLGWWPGNEKLKHRAIAITSSPVPSGPALTVAMVETEFDPQRGLVLEGTLRLPAAREARPVGLFLAHDSSSGTAILVQAGGITEFGPMQADGTGFKAEQRVDRECAIGPAASFRLLLKGSLIEYYLDDLLMQCYSLPQRAAGRIGLIQGGQSTSIGNLQAWECGVVDAISIFDGKTLNGWEGNTNNWRVEAGSIVAGSPERRQPHNEFLATRREFGNFELRLQYKVEGTNGFVNGGVQFWSQRVPNNFEVSGYQADLGAETDGNLYDESRRNRNLVEVEKETRKKMLRSGDWNDYRIRAEGAHIQLWLNGVKTVDYTESDQSIPQRGIIALQIHGEAYTKIQYRNIVMEELPELKRGEDR